MWIGLSELIIGMLAIAGIIVIGVLIDQSLEPPKKSIHVKYSGPPNYRRRRNGESSCEQCARKKYRGTVAPPICAKYNFELDSDRDLYVCDDHYSYVAQLADLIIEQDKEK